MAYIRGVDYIFVAMVTFADLFSKLAFSASASGSLEVLKFIKFANCKQNLVQTYFWNVKGFPSNPKQRMEKNV